MPDAEPLVTVATFDFVHKAELARSLLEDHGIRTFLLDAETVYMDWFLSGAIGGIKLQVSKADFLAAERLLADVRVPKPEANLDDYGLRKSTAFTAQPETVRDEQAQEDEADDESIEPSEADLTVERAFRAAILGFIFPPLLHLYSLSMLLPLEELKPHLSPENRKRLKATLAIDITVIVLSILLFFTCGIWIVRQ